MGHMELDLCRPVAVLLELKRMFENQGQRRASLWQKLRTRAGRKLPREKSPQVRRGRGVISMLESKFLPARVWPYIAARGVADAGRANCQSAEDLRQLGPRGQEKKWEHLPRLAMLIRRVCAAHDEACENVVGGIGMQCLHYGRSRQMSFSRLLRSTCMPFHRHDSLWNIRAGDSSVPNADKCSCYGR